MKKSENIECELTFALSLMTQIYEHVSREKGYSKVVDDSRIDNLRHHIACSKTKHKRFFQMTMQQLCNIIDRVDHMENMRD